VAETPKNEDLLIAACHFWSNSVNAFLFGHGPMSPTLADVYMITGLDLLPEEIIGTEDVPEYISSDSSLEAEDAMPEQRTNHPLCRRVRHLEHGLRDITARCQAERERRMALEALVGGKHF
jgi:hypothetical protein